MGMSKEQTPITAEAENWLKERGSQYSSDMTICYHMEQYAQAKVLEALENCDKFKIDASRLSPKEKIQFMSYIQNVSIKCDTTKQK